MRAGCSRRSKSTVMRRQGTTAKSRSTPIADDVAETAAGWTSGSVGSPPQGALDHLRPPSSRPPKVTENSGRSRAMLVHADKVVTAKLRKHAPMLVGVLLVVQIAAYAIGAVGAMSSPTQAPWFWDANETLLLAMSVLFACALFLTAHAVSQLEKQAGHDGWWWGFGVIFLGAFGMLIWLTHYWTDHKRPQTRTVRSMAHPGSNLAVQTGEDPVRPFGSSEPR